MERELDPSDLPAYYAENRLDAYDGPEKDGNMDWVPDDTRLFIEDDTPEERDAELEQMAMALVAMNVRALVLSGATFGGCMYSPFYIAAVTTWTSTTPITSWECLGAYEGLSSQAPWGRMRQCVS